MAQHASCQIGRGGSPSNTLGMRGTETGSPKLSAAWRVLAAQGPVGQERRWVEVGTRRRGTEPVRLIWDLAIEHWQHNADHWPSPPTLLQTLDVVFSGYAGRMHMSKCTPQSHQENVIPHILKCYQT